jgi:hypothetical protein
MSEIENNEYNTPLTKQPKVKSTSPKEIDTITQEVPIKEKKSRKPKTPAQLEQFKKMYEARKLKLEENKINKKIEASKFLLEHGVDIKKNKKIIKEPKIQVVDDSSSSGGSSSSEEEHIIVVKKKKTKNKSKKVIIQESSSSEEEPEQKHLERSFKHQRNKKSIIKVHTQPNKPTRNNVVIEHKNYFAD